MSAQHTARVALVAAVQAQVPGVQVSAVPLAQDMALKECVHVASGESRFEWRCLGPRRTNRSEEVALEVHVHVYREHGDQRQASELAMARAEELVQAVEYAVADDLTLGGAVTHALLRSVRLDPQPREKGWSVRGELRVESENFPTS